MMKMLRFVSFYKIYYFDPQHIPTYLRYLQQVTLSNVECRERQDSPTHQPLVYNGTICAFAQEGRGICYEDNGDPLTLNGQLIGLASWFTTVHCAVGFPDGYTRVSKFLEWIQNVAGIEAV